MYCDLRNFHCVLLHLHGPMVLGTNSRLPSPKCQFCTIKMINKIEPNWLNLEFRTYKNYYLQNMEIGNIYDASQVKPNIVARRREEIKECFS